jgi:hypothetical protein
MDENQPAGQRPREEEQQQQQRQERKWTKSFHTPGENAVCVLCEEEKKNCQDEEEKKKKVDFVDISIFFLFF